MTVDWSPPMTAADVREKLVEALGLDLIGPDRDDEHHDETLSQPPSRWYLTGFLVPQNAPEPQRCDDNGAEDIDEETGNGAGDDENTPEPPSTARRAFFPSSLGLSFLVPKAAKELRVTARWGDYVCLTPLEEAALPEEDSLETRRAGPAKGDLWQRRDRKVELPLPLQGDGKPTEHAVPDSGGLFLVLSVRAVHTTEAMELHLPKGSRSVSVFLVNRRDPRPDSRREEGFVFQGALDVRADTPFVARPNLRGLATDDRDECIADLQYADVCEYAVGHGVATRATLDPDGHCRLVETRWIPSAEVERVDAAKIPGIELQMENLAKLADVAEAKAKLSGLVVAYRDWIAGQRGKVPDQPKQRNATALDLLHQAEVAAGRIEAGIALLEQSDVFEAFRLANKCMAVAARQREGVLQGKEPVAVSAPAWRPFQLAFLLMNLRGLADPGHEERLAVDLLFFPTGGGKTEAYLGLAAFALVLRRLRDPGPMSAGVCVLMRYTLRLLTLDQLGRAATLICALELERQQDVTKLGKWPFEIGLWVGRAATPNVMGKKGDSNDQSARQRTIDFQRKRGGPPIPLENCPWCGTRFETSSFQLIPTESAPRDLIVLCANTACPFIRENALPLVMVDEPIYRRLPCFLIATVDKFAAMPWTGQVGALFGGVDRHDKEGFYGPCDPGQGQALPGRLPPPDLTRSRRLIHRKRLDGRRFRDEDKIPQHVVPVRFVRACQNGHIGDIDWYFFVHQHNANCRQQLYVDERGTSGDILDIAVRCQCGEWRRLSDAARSERLLLGKCRGDMPWLGPNRNVDCGEANRLLVRSASNAYFPRLMSVISLPDRDETLEKAVTAAWDFLETAESADDVRHERKKAKVAAALGDLKDEHVFVEIQRRKSEPLGPTKSVKQAELEVLTASQDEIGNDRPEGKFFAKALPRAQWDKEVPKEVERIVLVHRLREVTAQVGFTRFEAQTTDVDGELDIAAESAPLSYEASWLPAVENRGEGVFIQFRKDLLEQWKQQPAVRVRDKQLQTGYNRWLIDHPKGKKFPGIEYVLMHSLSHLLLQAVSLECGYPASSIRERVYSGDAGAGILLYTASPDAEGTLGGLVEAGRRIGRHLRNALALGRLCSNDPVCAQHAPANEHERRFLAGSACHGCLLIAETSCEQINDFLDRALVVPTVEDLGAEFFKV